MAGGEREDAQVMDSGEKRLNELGYKQELRREMVLSVPSSDAFFFPSSLSLLMFFVVWVCFRTFRRYTVRSGLNKPVLLWMDIAP
jgi:hypothetical protein